MPSNELQNFRAPSSRRDSQGPDAATLRAYENTVKICNFPPYFLSFYDPLEKFPTPDSGGIRRKSNKVQIYSLYVILRELSNVGLHLSELYSTTFYIVSNSEITNHW